MRITIATLATLALLGVTPNAAPAHTIAGDAGAQDLRTVEWALDRFDAAGLELPTMVVEFAADRKSCGGNTAVAIHGGSEPTIIVCADPDSPEVVIRRTLLHEMAHIWANAALDESTRRAFLDLRGLEAWAENPAWDGRGSEHAAEIVTWALMDEDLLMATIPDNDPADLDAGYALLTGRPVPER
ncbi:MAG TPA: hypothetical protein VLA29_02645 [Acidimicrobiia bacterium]|nr:hypothetical protein [Acidimicrobiia bacterium]